MKKSIFSVKKKINKVIVAMSGGVDSSVAALLLKKQGYLVEGVFMKNWEEDDNEEFCAAKKDLSDVVEVCNSLNITLHTVNFSFEYWNNVFINFLSEYKNGRTPNPDILCNKEIKFKLFLKFATEDLAGDFIATGHYVRCVSVNKQKYLLRAMDNNKDQSYFLYTLNQNQLSKCLFPLGEINKTKVRKIAQDAGLVTANKKDSTGICFIGKKNFRKFLSKYLPDQPGKILSVDGKKLGKHRGLMYYTLGQRKGIGIGGVHGYNQNPWYVIDKDIKNNNLIVDQDQNHPKLMTIRLIANQVNFIGQKIINRSFRCSVKTHYRQVDISSSVNILHNDVIEVIFDYPVTSVSPGQSVVCYQQDYCLGGGIIKSIYSLA